MKIKLALFSDTHKWHRSIKLPECDIAIFGGDLSDVGEMDSVIDFMDWYSGQYQCTHRVWIAGNHDLTFDPDRCTARLLPQWLSDALDRYCNPDNPNHLIYLYNSSVNLLGLNIYGSPITPDFFPEYWAFNKPRGEKIKRVWDQIPLDTDILVTHGPAKGLFDWVPGTGGFSVYPSGHVGCADLLNRIYQLPNLKAMLVGHIHCNHGTTDLYIGDRIVKYVNGAVADNRNNLIHQPILIEIDI